MKYELTSQDYRTIFEQATNEFIRRGPDYKETCNNFLVRCITESLLGHLKAKNLESKDGNLYVSKKDNETW